MKREVDKKEKQKEYYKKYKEKNKEKLDQYYKEYIEKNKEKLIKYGKEYKETNKEKLYNYYKNYKVNYTLKKYNLTKEDYNKIIDLQNGKCKICKIDFNVNQKPQIDHCHTTNKFRGLLCKKCNVGLGMFNDNIELFKNCIEYLHHYGNK